jgi:hypothetical protein
MPALKFNYTPEYFANTLIERNKSKFDCLYELFFSEREIVQLYDSEASTEQQTSTMLLAHIACLINASDLPLYREGETK